MPDTQRRTYIAAFSAGYGDPKRWNRMSLAFHTAVEVAAGGKPVTLLGSIKRNIAVFAVKSDLADADMVFDAIVDALPDLLFEMNSASPDRIFVAAVDGEVVGTDAVFDASFLLR